MEIEIYNKLQKFAKELDEVFTIKDLEAILGSSSNGAFYRKLEELIDGQALIKVKNGIYATTKAKLTSIASRICPKSYISMGTVLADKAIIGTVGYGVRAIKLGPARKYNLSLGTVEFLTITPKLFFGFEWLGDSFFATAEKAFLDTCYYYYKQKKFFFDPLSDINMELLDFRIVDEYLLKYDKRFVSFYKKNWELDAD